MLGFNPPEVWNINTEGNMERQMEVDFEILLIAISDHTGIPVDNITVRRFYAIMDYLEEKNKTSKTKITKITQAKTIPAHIQRCIAVLQIYAHCKYFSSLLDESYM